MALTLASVNVPDRSYVTGDRVEVIRDFTCDASYATNGYALTASTLGLSNLDFVNATVQAGPTATITGFTYDYVNSKLKALAGAAEVANATNLSTVVGRLVAKGKGFATSGTGNP
jgi:hypothetical protein